MSQSFQKNIENFSCDNCGAGVIGNGYTNHCPECLWSKHVDEAPGDRKNKCGGLMEPIKIELEKDEFAITHRCHRCLLEKKNKVAKNDKYEKLIEKKKNEK